MNLVTWCNRIIRFGFYLLFILVPIILTPWNYELFEYNKMMLTYALTAIIMGAWIVKMIHEKEFRIARTPLDIPIALFVLSQLTSTLFSMDPHVSWFGYYSRFNGGMFSIISYVLLYWAFVSNWSIIKKLPQVLVTTAAVVALYGVLEHLGIDRNLWVQDVQSRVFSTLGQPNWFAAYLVAIIPISLSLGLQSVFYVFCTILYFLVLLFTRSRSGYLGFAVADIVFWLMVFFSAKEKKLLRLPFFIVHAALLVIVLFNGVYIDQIDSWVTLRGWRDRFTHKQAPAPAPQLTPSGTALESGGTESGTIRKYVWQAAVAAWRGSTKNIFIGTGTETFAFAFYQYRPAGHNMTSEWDFLYNKAHNEYLNYLATTGVFGLGSYLLLIGTCIWWCIKNLRKMNALACALFAGWVSILVTNFFGFSVVIMQLFLFLFPAMIVVLSVPNAKYTVKPLRLPPWTMWIPAGMALVVLVILCRFWKADTLYASANRLGRSGNFAQAQTLDAQAIARNPGEPVYRDDISSVLASLSLAAAEGKNATLAADLARRSLAESDRALAISPHNVNFWKTRTKLYYTFSVLDPTLNAVAAGALEKASALSPNDPKIYYNLAILEGRDGNNDKAIELLNKAKILKPNYRDAYFGLYIFYSQLKQPDLARAQLQEYLTRVDPTDRDFQDRLTQ